MNSAGLLHDTYGYQIQGDSDCDSLEQHRGFSNHPPSFENEGPASQGALFRASEPNSMSQSAIHPLSLHAANSFDFRPAAPNSSASGNDLSFQASSGMPIGPLASGRASSNNHSSAGSSYAFLQQNHQYPLNPNVSYHGIASHPGAPSTLYSPAANYSAQTSLHNSLEVRPRLTALTPNSGMPPPSRNSTIPSPVSPPLGSTFRNDYSAPLSHLPRHGFAQQGNIYQLSSSPQSPLSAMSRSLDSSAGRNQSVPPFEPTKAFYPLSDARGGSVHADIQAKIDKGFFRADSDWTCYRRNYFSVACAYSLKSDVDVDPEQVYIHRQSSSPEKCFAFAVCIAAKVDGEDGKPIELVQHTPKRDKGPMSTPEKRELKPNPSGNLSVFTGSASFNPSQLHSPELDHIYHGTSENHNVANFERIQFKKATANNGKRRAAQQYFHIVVELFAKLRKGKSEEYEWAKIAHRVSAQMVVRGRSPGHYSDERRGSSTSMGGGGASGGDNYGYHGDMPKPGLNILGSLGGGGRYSGAGCGYQTHNSSMTHSPPSDCPSVPSSASSITSSALHDGLQQHSSLHIDDSTMNDIYDNHFEGHVLNTTSRPGGTRSTTNEASSPLDGSFPYVNPPTLKGEPPFLKTDPGRQSRLGVSLSPTFGMDWSPSETHVPPRECRPLSLERDRNFYPPMSTL